MGFTTNDKAGHASADTDSAGVSSKLYTALAARCTTRLPSSWALPASSGLVTLVNTVTATSRPVRENIRCHGSHRPVPRFVGNRLAERVRRIWSSLPAPSSRPGSIPRLGGYDLTSIDSLQERQQLLPVDIIISGRGFCGRHHFSAQLHGFKSLFIY